MNFVALCIDITKNGYEIFRGHSKLEKSENSNSKRAKKKFSLVSIWRLDEAENSNAYWRNKSGGKKRIRHFDDDSIIFLNKVMAA